MVTPVFQFVAIASYTVPGHHWKGPASILFASSIKVFTDIDEILPKPSLLQAEESQLSQAYLIDDIQGTSSP